MTEFERMIKFLDQAWYLKSEIVPCLIGAVGIGKTAAVRQHAKNVGAKNVVTIIASQILPSEVSGITMPDSSTKSMEIYDHYKLSSLQDGDILFFDELLEADQSVLSACLTLIESRMMMSGKLLPDIQIIAATNPTVMPSSLKENIRQRFMFMKFKIDKDSVQSYIQEQTGIKVPKEILSLLEGKSDKYNILSPRSLTKLCMWISSTPYNELDSLAKTIDNIWNNGLGTALVEARKKTDNSPKAQVLRKVKELIPEQLSEEKDIEDCTMEELYEILQSLDNWQELKQQLEAASIEEAETTVNY